jgi:hypothetical protein
MPLKDNFYKSTIDTCGFDFSPLPNLCSEGLTSAGLYVRLAKERRFYTKNRVRVTLFVPAIIPWPDSPDSSVVVLWTAIDTSYAEIRAGFQRIEQYFGLFKLKAVRYYSDKQEQWFAMLFDNYVNGLDVKDSLNIIPNTMGWCMDFFEIPANAVEENLQTESILSTSNEIIIPATTGRTTIELFSVGGVLLRQLTTDASNVTLDVSEFPIGLYFLKINSTIRKLILQR